MAINKHKLLAYLNGFIGSFGYKFERKSCLHAMIVPYLRHYCIHGRQFSLWIPDNISKDWYDGPVQDWDSIAEIRELVRLVEPGSHVLEIGCHIGFHTIFLAQLVGPQGKICALEASPRNALVAQAQVGTNRACESVTVLNAAASDQTQDLSFRGEHIESEITTEDIRVQGIRGDSLMESFGPFDLLKVDVEGYEEVVLKGCKAILGCKPKLALEIHLDLLSRYQSSVSNLFKLIDIDNYRGTMILRPDWHTLRDFSIEALPKTGVVNLFLEPVGY